MRGELPKSFKVSGACVLLSNKKLNVIEDSFLTKWENKPPYSAIKHREDYQSQMHISIFSLTHFQPMFHFYTPWKNQKTGGFLMFSGGMDVEH